MLEQHAQGHCARRLAVSAFTLQMRKGCACSLPIGGRLGHLVACRSTENCVKSCWVASWKHIRFSKPIWGRVSGVMPTALPMHNFRLNDKIVTLTANQGKHQLHGGVNGFDKRRWVLEKCGENFVCFSLHSADGDQGFPGNVDVTVTYTLTEENSVKIEYAGKAIRIRH